MAFLRIVDPSWNLTFRWIASLLDLFENCVCLGVGNTNVAVIRVDLFAKWTCDDSVALVYTVADFLIVVPIYWIIGAQRVGGAVTAVLAVIDVFFLLLNLLDRNADTWVVNAVGFTEVACFRNAVGLVLAVAEVWVPVPA